MAKELPKTTYTSCIKIRGVPILPPLMTPERRLEMERYKCKAMEIEKRIKNRPEHRPTVTLDKTLENSLAFDDSFALIDDECDTVLPRNVPLEQTKTQLTCNIFDVTEYSNNGFTLFNEERQRPDLQISTSAVTVEEGTKSTPPPRLSHSQPRLLRSNSYTLDAPSPVLLEHFKQHIKEQRDNSTVPVGESPPSDSSSKFNSIDSIIPQGSVTIDQIGFLIESLANVHYGNVHDNISSPSNTTAVGGYSSGTPEILNTSSSVQLIDFESDTGDNLTPCFDGDCLVDLLSGVTPRNVEQSCARELFVDSPKQLCKEWAATVLTSAARGYLVRRLKRTERVKTLIQTISDTLLCAMSLHSEQTDRIQASDVELHRRLIQQISAACYEFHDIFFTLSTRERMEIISLDRERLKEKLKRPASTSSLKLDSDRSSRSSQTNSFHTKQKKALVTSLVA